MKSRWKIFAPIAVFVTVAGTIMILAVVGAALTVNADTAARQTTLLNNGLAGRVQEINHQVVTQVVWDDAVQHLDNQFDPEWAKSNIGAFLATTDGFDGASVLDSADRPIYAMRAGVDVDAARFGNPDPASAPLVAWVRRAEARRLITGVQNWSRLMKAPIQASAFAKHDGRLQLITATLVQPDFGHVPLQAPHAPVVLTVRNLDDAFVTSLGERFMLKDLHIAGSPETGGVALTGPGGETLGRLVWTPDRPGDNILRRGLPLVLVCLALLALIARVLYRRASKAAEDLVASEARASHLARHDGLTGLPNRRMFEDRLAHALVQARRASRPIGVLLIDLKRPQDVADRQGSVASEDWLGKIAVKLKDTCRGSDTLARLGADRFAVVQADGSVSGAAALAERLLVAFKAPLLLGGGGAVQIECSIGAAVAAGEAVDPGDVVRQADVALRRAQELGGRQCCFFEPEMDAAQRLRRALESDLRQALIDDALEVHYQPQVDGDGVIIGLEALTRWNHPERGFISPSIFFQIAEESGLTGPLGLFTIKRAFEDSVRWRDLKVAINMTARQISMPGLEGDIRALLAKFEIPPDRVELEINESVLLENNEQTPSILRRLKALGLSVALDNFGAGLSRLGQLRRYPIDKIKIDRSFVSTLGIDPESDAVVSALIKLARAFDFGVMAEGVETLDQRRRLIEAGCPKAQGFLFSRALTPEAMEAFIQACPVAETV